MSYQSDFNDICTAVSENIENFLDYFEIDYHRTNDQITFSCPIHGSSKANSLSIKLGDYSVWKCWTNHCEEEVCEEKYGSKVLTRARGKNILGLIRSLMSLDEDQVCSYAECIKWVKDFLGMEDNGFTREKVYADRIYEKLNRSLERPELTIKTSREEVREGLYIPSTYFVERGFAPYILDKYDVGDAVKLDKDMAERAIVPVYDDDGQNAVGFLGRSLYEECPECGGYHREGPCYYVPKWFNAFQSQHYLYNYWFAKDFINTSQTVILVEGQGDIWRLEEAEIHNALGLFGTDLTDQQKYLLNTLDLHTIVIATDNDEEGQKAVPRLTEKLNRMYNIKVVHPPLKDWGETSIEDIHAQFNNN